MKINGLTPKQEKIKLDFTIKYYKVKLIGDETGWKI